MVLIGWASNPVVATICILLPIIAGFSVGLRILARCVVQKNAGWDDGCIGASLLFSIATTVTIIAQTQTGLGKHMSQISKSDAFLNQRDFFVMIIMYNLSLTFTKLSILLQYKRLFPQKGFKLAVHLVMGVVVIYALWRFFSAVFTCAPVQAFWDHSIKNYTCQDKFAIAMASTALNMATDLVIACLPLPVLNKLQLPSRQKYALMGVFALAGLVIIISILRLPSLIKLWETKDTSYQNPMVMIWSSVEINVGIICSCLPTLRCLFPRLFKAATGYASGRSTGFSDGSRSGGGGKDRNKQDRKSQGYAYVCKSNSGQGSFGGKFSSKVSISTVNKSLVEKTSRRTKDPQLLECVEEIEMGCAKDDQSVTTDAPRGRCDVNLGQIVVRTDIEQVAHVKSSANASRRGTKDSGTLERELV
ncbi:SAT4 family membrane protein [Sphaerulina musiva]